MHVLDLFKTTLVPDETKYEEIVTPRGELIKIEIDGNALEYYAVSPTYFEYWQDGDRRGSIEQELSENRENADSYGAALKNVSTPNFLAVMEISEEEKQFETIGRALLWIHNLCVHGR